MKQPTDGLAKALTESAVSQVCPSSPASPGPPGLATPTAPPVISSRPSALMLQVGQWRVPTALVGFPTSLLLHVAMLASFYLMPGHVKITPAGSLAQSQRVVQVTIYLKPAASQGPQSPASAGGPKRPELTEEKSPPKPKSPATNLDKAAQADPSDSRPSIDGPLGDVATQATVQTNAPDPSVTTGPDDLAVSDKPGDDQLGDQLSKTSSPETEESTRSQIIESPSPTITDAELTPAKLNLADAAHEIDHNPAKLIVALAIAPPVMAKASAPENGQPETGKPDRQTLASAQAPESDPSESKLPESKLPEAKSSETRSSETGWPDSGSSGPKAQPTAPTSTSASEAQATSSVSAQTPSASVPARVIYEPANKSKYYPRRSRLIGEEGVVTLAIEVLANGDIGKIETRDGPSSRLIRAAVKYARDCRYAPATIKGRPVRGDLVWSIPFKLN